MENKLREVLKYVISSGDYKSFYQENSQISPQKETSAKFTKVEKILYLDLKNKRIFELNPNQRKMARKILNKLRGEERKKFRGYVYYVEELMKKYNRLQVLNKQIKNFELERRGLKLGLELEYKTIKKNKIKTTGSNFNDMHLDYIVYNIKDDVSNEDRYIHLKNMYGKKKTKEYYSKYKPGDLYKNF